LIVEPLVRIPVGVVVERRKATSQWVDFLWRPVAVLPDRPQMPAWTLMHGDAETATFYAGAAEIGLYRTETPRYRENLHAGGGLWVVLRSTGTEPALQLVAVTADPSEGEAFTEAGGDLVDQVPMPETIRAVVADFIAEHHVEDAFVKRKRDRADPEALARRGPLADKDRK